MNDTDRAPEPIALIVVRTGAVDRFAALRAAFAPEGVEVVWDRRVGERRRSSEPGPARDLSDAAGIAAAPSRRAGRSSTSSSFPPASPIS